MTKDGSKENASSVKKSKVTTRDPTLSEEDICLNAKLVFSSMGMKLFRFATLGYLYQVYDVFSILAEIGMRNYFTPIYLYVWTVTSLGLGVILFLFGRTTLVCEDIVETIQQMNMPAFKVLCDGTFYRLFNLALNWLYPYVVITTWCFYTKVRVIHSTFIITYYAGLALLHYRKDFNFNHKTSLIMMAQAKRQEQDLDNNNKSGDSISNNDNSSDEGDLRSKLRFIGQSLIALSHMYICILAGNWWGVVAGLSMIYSISLATDFGRNSIVTKLFVKIRSRVSVPWLLVIALVSSTYSITQSFHHMNPPGPADDLKVSMEDVLYFNFLQKFAIDNKLITPHVAETTYPEQIQVDDAISEMDVEMENTEYFAT